MRKFKKHVNTTDIPNKNRGHKRFQFLKIFILKRISLSHVLNKKMGESIYSIN